MKLNEKKTNNMILNFSTNKQFFTDIKVNGEVIETVKEARLLGTIISSDLKWEANTKYLVKDSIFACFYQFFHGKLRAQVQDLQKREFYDLPEHGAATTKARGGLGTIQTSWARRAIKIMAVDSCELH